MTDSSENLKTQIAALKQEIEKNNLKIHELKKEIESTKTTGCQDSRAERENQLQLIKTLFDVIPNPVFYKNIKEYISDAINLLHS